MTGPGHSDDDSISVQKITDTHDDGYETHRWRVKQVGRWYIEVVPQIFNWRIHTVDSQAGPWASSDRYWCYEGRCATTFVGAILAAHAWDGADDTEPVGWIKSWDGRRHGNGPCRKTTPR